MPRPFRLLLLNKPFNVICQFSPHPTYATLADFIPYPHLYPAGRLDTDSEGLTLLTDDGLLQHHITDPQHKLPKTYWAQVEGCPTAATLALLRRGITLKDGLTRPAEVQHLKDIIEFNERGEPPTVWPRIPPIRERKTIPTTWIELILYEGRNRQVRRMTAAVGFPTLRLIRMRIGPWSVEGLTPGAIRWVET